MTDHKLFVNACAMWALNAKVIHSLMEKFNPDTYEAVFQAILDCKGKVATMGMGTSSVAARKIAHMLCVANIPSFFVSAGDAAQRPLGARQVGVLNILG